MAAALIAVIAGCKKDSNNSPQGPAGPPDTWIHVIRLDSSNEFMSDLVETTDGGFVMAGDFSSAMGQGNYVLKVNAQGDTLWSRHYAVDGILDELNGIVATADGGALAIGRLTPSGHSSEEALLIRLNESGGVVWQRVTNKELGFAGWNGTLLNDGGIIIAAYSGLLKINANGDTVWTRTFENLSFFGAIALGDGGALVTGNRYHDFDNWSAVIMRCNAQGDSLWTREIPLADMKMYPWDITRTGDGDYVVIAQYDNFPTGDTRGTWAAKLSETGQVRWSNTYEDNAYFYRVATGADGLPVIVGGTGDSGNSDILLMKLNTSGDVVWTRTYLTALAESGYAITATSDGGFVVAGSIAGVVYSDIIVIKVNADGEI
jgi:hypothetical protein